MELIDCFALLKEFYMIAQLRLALWQLMGIGRSSEPLHVSFVQCRI